MITCKKLHNMLWRGVRFNWESDLSELTQNGVYVMFEKGETAYGGDRIVRIGINREQDKLKDRITNHLIGTTRKSIFRKHIGSALSNKQGTPATEQQISDYIKENITFAVIEVRDKTKREELERRLIATLAQAEDFCPSENWLGKYCEAKQIANGKLWNVQGLKAEILNDEYIQLIWDGLVLSCDISKDFKDFLSD